MCMIVCLKVPRKYLFCVELNSPRCLIKKVLAKQKADSYRYPVLENYFKNCLNAIRESAEFKILSIYGARACWLIGLDRRQLSVHRAPLPLNYWPQQAWYAVVPNGLPLSVEYKNQVRPGIRPSP